MRLIDADELKEYLHKQNDRPFIGMTIGEMIEMFIDEQPTVDTVVRGKWEYSKEYNACSCSNCGEIPDCFEPRFCPNCGADMRGEQYD